MTEISGTMQGKPLLIFSRVCIYGLWKGKTVQYMQCHSMHENLQIDFLIFKKIAFCGWYFSLSMQSQEHISAFNLKMKENVKLNSWKICQHETCMKWLWRTIASICLFLLIFSDFMNSTMKVIWDMPKPQTLNSCLKIPSKYKFCDWRVIYQSQLVTIKCFPI